MNAAAETAALAAAEPSARTINIAPTPVIDPQWLVRNPDAAIVNEQTGDVAYYAPHALAGALHMRTPGIWIVVGPCDQDGFDTFVSETWQAATKTPRIAAGDGQA
jgi:hypothetical protein